MGNNELREALEDMVFQYGYRGVKNGKPTLFGASSAINSAFKVLGWDNPRYLPEEGYTCEGKGCMEADTCGTPWGKGGPYLRICSEHYQMALEGEPMPEIKQYALDREATRDPITRILPSVKT